MYEINDECHHFTRAAYILYITSPIYVTRFFLMVSTIQILLFEGAEVDRDSGIFETINTIAYFASYRNQFILLSKLFYLRVQIYISSTSQWVDNITGYFTRHHI
jgi:hypothetical protein